MKVLGKKTGKGEALEKVSSGMNNVVNINPETLEYIIIDRDVIGVSDSECGIEFSKSKIDGYFYINTDHDNIIKKDKLRDLCVAWLALYSPECLAYDED